MYNLKGIKLHEKLCFILLKSWMLTPFETHMYFSIEMLWSTFAPTPNSPIDSMQKGR